MKKNIQKYLHQKNYFELRTSLITRIITTPFNGYQNDRGRYFTTKVEDWIHSRSGKFYRGKINLILTSPPFPLKRKKRYGNLQGQKYVEWLEGLSAQFNELLTDDGSLVIEIGNAWEPGKPTISTLPIETLMAIKQKGHFHLCQEFICHNPARLPTPVEYVNIRRYRLKDSWTRVWWLGKNPEPKANNKNVLLPYSKSMQDLLKKQSYNSGERPSEHVIGNKSFLKKHKGSIPASCLTDEVLDYYGSLIVSGNTASSGDKYLKWCRDHGVRPHPARMQKTLVAFFISLLTDENDLVFDPFAGSNTTGAVANLLKRRWISIEANEENLIPSLSRFK